MSVVAAALVFLLFVQGGQTFIDILGKNEDEKTMVINSVGRKWEFTFTTLILFAAGMFASFPLFYATSLGGAYYAWKIFLICFVLQAVSFEFRRKKGNLLGQRTYEYFLYFNGFFGPFLLGAVVATFFTGSEFLRNEYNLSTWQTQFYGIEILFNHVNLSLGFAIMFLARLLGALYLTNNINHEPILKRARKQVGINAVLFLVFFLYFMARILLKDGYAYDPETWVVFMEPYKYLNNFLQMPIVLVMFLVGVVLVLYGIAINWFIESRKGIWFTGPGVFLVVLALFMILGFNNTAFYPSSFDIQSSLTIRNASSSNFTLKTMFYISLFTPVVVAYIWYIWRTLDKHKIDPKDIEDGKEHHVY